MFVRPPKYFLRSRCDKKLHEGQQWSKLLRQRANRHWGQPWTVSDRRKHQTMGCLFEAGGKSGQIPVGWNEIMELAHWGVWLKWGQSYRPGQGSWENANIWLYRTWCLPKPNQVLCVLNTPQRCHSIKLKFIISVICKHSAVPTFILVIELQFSLESLFVYKQIHCVKDAIRFYVMASSNPLYSSRYLHYFSLLFSVILPVFFLLLLLTQNDFLCFHIFCSSSVF